MDTLFAAPVAGPVCAIAAWWLTPWLARRRLARIERKRGRPLDPNEHLNWEIWGSARHEHGAMWRTFLTEQHDLVHTIDRLTERLGQVAAPSLVIADPVDKLIPVGTAFAIRDRLPQSQFVLAEEGGHHLPRRAPKLVAGEITRLVKSLG